MSSQNWCNAGTTSCATTRSQSTNSPRLLADFLFGQMSPAPTQGKMTRTMERAKDQVKQILENLPEDASLEDIQYHIYVRQKIERGIADVDAGRVISHEEVQRRLTKWRAK